MLYSSRIENSGLVLEVARVQELQKRDLLLLLQHGMQRIRKAGLVFSNLQRGNCEYLGDPERKIVRVTNPNQKSNLSRKIHYKI